MKYTFTEQEFQEAVASSFSTAEVAKKLNMGINGTTYRTLNRKFRQTSIDKSHFKQQGWAKGKTFPSKRPIEDYLNDFQPISSHKLKERLFKEGIKEKRCEICGISTWNGKPISLELHHKDRIHENNSLENLAILCPNCHSQFPNREKKDKLKKSKENPNWRSKPRTQARKTKRPSKEELQQLLSENSWCAVGRKFNVSDNAVRKWAKTYEITK